MMTLGGTDALPPPCWVPMPAPRPRPLASSERPLLLSSPAGLPGVPTPGSCSSQWPLVLCSAAVFPRPQEAISRPGHRKLQRTSSELSHLHPRHPILFVEMAVFSFECFPGVACPGAFLVSYQAALSFSICRTGKFCLPPAQPPCRAWKFLSLCRLPQPGSYVLRGTSPLSTDLTHQKVGTHQL